MAAARPCRSDHAKWAPSTTQPRAPRSTTPSGSSDGIAADDGEKPGLRLLRRANEERSGRHRQREGRRGNSPPLIMGAVALAYNLPDVPFLKLSGPVLADIYLGKIKKWNEEPIAKLNPGVALPDLGITPVYRQEEAEPRTSVGIPLEGQLGIRQKVGASTQPEMARNRPRPERQ